MLIVFNQEKPAKPRLLLVLSISIFLLTLSAAIWLSVTRSRGEPLPLTPALRVETGVSVSLPVGWKPKIQSTGEHGTILTASPAGWSDGLESEDDGTFSPPGSKINLGKFFLQIRQRLPGLSAEHLAAFLDLDGEDALQQITTAAIGPLAGSGYELRNRSGVWLVRLAVAPSGLELLMILRCRGHEISSGRLVLDQIARSVQIDMPACGQAIQDFSTAAGVNLNPPAGWLAYYRNQPAELPAAVSPHPLYLQPGAELAPQNQVWQMTVYPAWLGVGQSPEQLLTERVAQHYRWLTPPPCQIAIQGPLQIVRLNVNAPPEGDPAAFWLITPSPTAGENPVLILETHFPRGQLSTVEEVVKQVVAGLKFPAAASQPAGRNVFPEWLNAYGSTPLGQLTGHPLVQGSPFREWYIARFDGQPIGYQTNLYRMPVPASSPAALTTQPQADSSNLIVETLDYRPREQTVRQIEFGADRTWSSQENERLLGSPGQGPRNLRLTTAQMQPAGPIQVRAYSGREHVKLEKKLLPGPDVVSDPGVDFLLTWLAREGQPGDQVGFRTLGFIPGHYVSWRLRALPPSPSGNTRNQRQYLELCSNLGSGPALYEFTLDGQLKRITHGLFTITLSSESEVQSYFNQVPKQLADFLKDLNAP